MTSESPPDHPLGIMQGSAYEIRLEGTTLAAPIDVELPYGPEPIAAPFGVETLFVGRWDGEGWHPVTSAADPEHRVIRASTGQLSTFAVFEVDIAEVNRLVEELAERMRGYLFTSVFQPEAIAPSCEEPEPPLELDQTLPLVYWCGEDTSQAGTVRLRLVNRRLFSMVMDLPREATVEGNSTAFTAGHLAAEFGLRSDQQVVGPGSELDILLGFAPSGPSTSRLGVGASHVSIALDALAAAASLVLLPVQSLQYLDDLVDVEAFVECAATQLATGDQLDPQFLLKTTVGCMLQLGLAITSDAVETIFAALPLLHALADEFAFEWAELTGQEGVIEIRYLASAAVPAGTWVGTVFQPGVGRYAVTMQIGECSIGQLCGTTSYPEIPTTSGPVQCAGVLTYLGVEGGTFRFGEHVTSGATCVDTEISVRLLDEYRIDWLAVSLDLRYEAAGTLEKATGG